MEYLTREIILLDPTEGCVMKGSAGDWDTLPRDKSLFHSGEDCGLPIGNLTSQLFSNVYLGHYRSYRVRKETFSGMKAFQRYGLFDLRLSRYAALRMAGERTTY